MSKPLCILPAFAWLLTSLGCGARSSLSEAASGSSPCGHLERSGPVVSPAIMPGMFEDYVRLLPSSADEEDVSFTLLGSDQSGQVIIFHGVLSPWTHWPADGDLKPVLASSIATMDSGSVGSAPHGHYAVTALSATGLELYPDVDPLVAGSGAPPIALPGNDGAFVAPRAAGLAGPTALVGEYDATGGGVVRGHVIDGAVVASTVLACGTGQPPTASAVPFEDGWLVAASSGVSDPASCGSGPGSVDRVLILRVAADGHAEVLSELDGGGFVVTVQAVPHPDGIYVTWLTAVPATGMNAIGVARFVPSRGVLVGPIFVGAKDERPRGLVASSLGRALVIARARSVGGASSDLAITTLDESLTEQAASALSPGPFFGPTTVLGAPDGRSVLVGFALSETTLSRAALARFDCAP